MILANNNKQYVAGRSPEGRLLGYMWARLELPACNVFGHLRY